MLGFQQNNKPDWLHGHSIDGRKYVGAESDIFDFAKLRHRCVWTSRLSYVIKIIQQEKKRRGGMLMLTKVVKIDKEWLKSGKNRNTGIWASNRACNIHWSTSKTLIKGICVCAWFKNEYNRATMSQSSKVLTKTANFMTSPQPNTKKSRNHKNTR